MLRIGAFAILTGLSIDMLRHYDTIGLLTPQKTDPATGYRLYDEAQLVDANRISALKDLGFGLEEILRYDKKQIAGMVKEKLAQKQREALLIQRQISQLHKALEATTSYREQMLSIHTKVFAPQNIVFLEDTLKDFPEEGVLWTRFMPVAFTRMPDSTSGPIKGAYRNSPIVPFPPIKSNEVFTQSGEPKYLVYGADRYL